MYNEDGDSRCSIDSYSSTDSVLDSVLLWEREGMLLIHRESSYTDQLFVRTISTKRININYDRYHPGELKRFVISRLLKDPYPQGVTLKYYYLRLLDQADRQFQFRFFDLPPEIRLGVYRNLLRYADPPFHPLDFGNVYPAILRVCKDVQKEATSVLYDENTFSTTFQAGSGEHGFGVGYNATVHNHFSTARCVHAPYLRIPKGLDDYPEFFRRISRLQVLAKFTTITDEIRSENATWPLNHFLYTLASFLMDGHSLKTLILKLDISSSIDDSTYGMILYPLRRLRNITDVTIEGHIPNKVKTKLVNDLQSSEPAFNTMRHWNLIHDEAVTQFEIHQAVHNDTVCLCGECHVPECVEEFASRLECLDEFSMLSCFSSRHEEHFLAHLNTVRKYLDSMKIEEMKQLLQTVTQKRAALAEYEAVSDEGRLEEAGRIFGGNLHSTVLKYNFEDDWSEDFDGVAVDKLEEVKEEKESQSDNPGRNIQDSDDATDSGDGEVMDRN